MTHLLAAIRCPDAGGDDLLAAVARVLQAQGLRLTGHVQRTFPDPSDACCEITHVEDIQTGARINITQALGAGSTGCRLDPAALAGVAGDLLVALDAVPDLVLVNRFGKGEAEGQGLRAVIERAFAAGIPVLTLLRDSHAPAWEAFTGGEAELLPADASAILRWVQAAVAEARRARAA
ncbi:MAG: DUF2478 domain-containing protein [Paracoccaceae bacterium]|nr:DUF2478 domain-containing protein [Paracoccaceae bacterium]